MARTRRKYSTDDPVTQYALDVTSGKIPSNKLQRLACERHRKDREKYDTLPSGLSKERRAKWKSKTPYYWDPDFCDGKLGFFPQLVHWRGQLVGQPFELMGWQTFCTGSLFGWFKKDNSYRFETAHCSLPKKSGKSIWVGAIALLRGFFDGEAGSEVFSIATTREQANIVWKEAYELKRRSTNPLVQRLKVFEGRRNIHDDKTRSKFEPLSADRDSGDGVNPYCLIADEVHRYKDADLLNMLQESMATRRNRLTLEITTAG
jgi:phage terminase large subunit-like protein